MRVAPWQENKTLLKIARCTSKHSSSCSKLSSKPWVILYHPNCSYRENFGITITWCGQVPLTPMLTSKFRYYNNLMVFVPSLRLKKKKNCTLDQKKRVRYQIFYCYSKWHMNSRRMLCSGGDCWAWTRVCLLPDSARGERGRSGQQAHQPKIRGRYCMANGRIKKKRHDLNVTLLGTLRTK